MCYSPIRDKDSEVEDAAVVQTRVDEDDTMPFCEQRMFVMNAENLRV